MRRRLESALRKLWMGEMGPGGSLLSAALLPLEIFYGGGVALRNRLYDMGVLPAIPTDVPVVSVGNLIVGGAGKTPVSAWLARFLSDLDRSPAVVSRGYGKDEVALHRRWNPDVPVVVDPNRVQGAREARRNGHGAVILDDGFQHRRLRRDLDIVLHPAEDPGREHLLPGGPYREPRKSLGRADYLVLTRRTASPAEAEAAERELSASFPDLPVAHVHLKAAGWSNLSGEPADPPTGPLLAVTAIARPRSFARLAERTADAPVELMSYPDHHRFTRKEVEEIRRRALGRTVVTTEKDAVRVEGTPHPFGDSARVLRLDVVGEAGVDGLVDALLTATAGAAAVNEDGRSSVRKNGEEAATGPDVPGPSAPGSPPPGSTTPGSEGRGEHERPVDASSGGEPT